MLRAIRRPSATARGSRENWSLSRTMSAIPLVIWLPEPIATAIRACFSAGHVVDAVADHRRVAARGRERADQRLLLLGADPAEDRVAARRPRPARRARRAARGPRSRRRPPARRPRRRPRSPSRGASPEISFRSIFCSRMNAIVSAASGRSVSSSTTSASGETAAAPRPRGRRAARPGRAPNATTRRPAAVCCSSLRCELGRQLQRSLRGEHVGRAQHVGLAAARRPASARSTSTPRRTAPRRRPAPPFAGVVLGDRLEGAVALAGAGGEPRQRLVGRAGAGGVGDLDPDQLQLAARSASRSCRRRSCRPRRGSRSRHLLHQGVEFGEPHRGHGEGDAHQQHQALGDQRDQPRGRRLRRLLERRRCGRTARRSGSTASGTISQVQATITRLTSSCSGEGGWRKARASPATFSA